MLFLWYLVYQAFEDRNGVESSRRFKENYLALEDDEEEGPGNSNAVEHRLKVPPDKPDEKSDDKVLVKSKGENRLSDGPNRYVHFLLFLLNACNSI